MVLDSRGRARNTFYAAVPKSVSSGKFLPVDYFLLENREKAAENGSLLL